MLYVAHVAPLQNWELQAILNLTDDHIAVTRASLGHGSGYCLGNYAYVVAKVFSDGETSERTRAARLIKDLRSLGGSKGVSFVTEAYENPLEQWRDGFVDLDGSTWDNLIEATKAILEDQQKSGIFHDIDVPQGLTVG